MRDAPDRGAPSSVRGSLSEAYLRALVSSQADQLVRRLGDRATVDDPIFGRASGLAELGRHLAEAARWFAERESAFETITFTTGSDRDVTEGNLSLVSEGKRLTVPIAVVAERRPEREVEVRLYHSTRGLRPTTVPRAQLVPQDDELTVPPPVAAYLQALARGDVDAVVASFERGAAVRDASGAIHPKTEEGGALAAFFQAWLGGKGTPSHPVKVLKGARADDGRTCALEHTWVASRGESAVAQAGLAVFERGESGLLRALRLYQDM